MARITDRDIELLSAYLDGELTTAERSALDARLQVEPELRRELDTLRATVTLIQGLPAVKAPRDYTLDAPPPRLWIFPATAAFSAISAAAATLLVVLGVITLLSTAAPTAAPSAGAPLVAAQPTSFSTPTAAATKLTASPSPAALGGMRANSAAAKASATQTTTSEEQEAAGADAARLAEPGALMLPASPAQPQEAAPSIMMESAALPTGTADFFFGAAPPPQGTMLADMALAQEAPPTPAPTATVTPSPTDTPTPTEAPTPTPTVTPAPAAPAGPDTTGVLMVIGGVLLMALAIGTSLVRRRGQP